MPEYDYRCKTCQHTFSIFYKSYADVDGDAATCPECSSSDLSRLIKRVALLTDDETRVERLADPSRLGGLDEDDPRALGRMMRDMSTEFGEDLGGEFQEVTERLEAGESPETIEKSMPLSDEGFSNED